MTPLRAALINGHHGLYQNSSLFHQTIDFLANSLPLWVDAIAEQSRQEEGKLKALMKAMETTPGPRFYPEETK